MKFEIATRTVSGQSVQTVNAREVHKNLEVKKDFSDWVKAQIKRARLVENRDFVAVPQKGVGGKFDSIDYHLTIEAAKHFGMLSGTSKGFEVREYFLECERKVNTPASAPQVKSPAMQMIIAQAMAFDRMEQEQQRQATELARIQESVAVIEARTQPENKHFTVLGYSNLIGKQVDFKTASKIGKKCADLSREQGMVIGDVKDPRFGKVHSYHESILQAVMDSSASV